MQYCNTLLWSCKQSLLLLLLCYVRAFQYKVLNGILYTNNNNNNNNFICTPHWIIYIYVVVQFYPWFKFSFLLFQTHYRVIIIHYLTQKQKKRKFEPRIKLNHDIYILLKIEKVRAAHNYHWGLKRLGSLI